jgi:hypothetical protein
MKAVTSIDFNINNMTEQINNDLSSFSQYDNENNSLNRLNNEINLSVSFPNSIQTPESLKTILKKWENLEFTAEFQVPKRKKF